MTTTRYSNFLQPVVGQRAECHSGEQGRHRHAHLHGIEPSADDQTFGFGSRPTKQVLVPAMAVAA